MTKDEALQMCLEYIETDAHERKYVRHAIKQALAAQPAVPEGMKLVPGEPTDKMVQAAYHLDLSYMPGQEGADRAAIYRAMLAAAPQQALATPVQEPVAWMPIETAPQDGTKILGWNEKFGARETQMTFYGEGSPGFAAWKSRKGPKESGWNWSEPKSNWSHTWKPTHWMPMPAAPVLEAAIGYSEGYQEGWNAAMDSTPPAAPVQECFWRREGYKECPAAQRQWVGLTVLEQADCFANTEDATEFYHAIEAKLKEKNSD